LDPGGASAFGWCVLEDGPTLPLRVRASGVADDAAAAVDAVDHARAGDDIAAAGIDAPMFWIASGDRQADICVRNAIRDRGASPGTVNHVSSLRGACLVQGMVAAMLLRQRIPTVPVTEAHPKAALWMLGVATKERKVVTITAEMLTSYFDMGAHRMAADHERDAALAALSAWAMVHRAAGWEDIRGRDPLDVLTPLASPVAYWLPVPRPLVE
jgi:hypothetical protein